MIDINKKEFQAKYDLGTVAELLNLNFGRNLLYQLLKEKRIISQHNSPAMEYVRKGLLDTEFPFAPPDGCSTIAKTVVVGDRGLEFIKQIVEEYLKNNQRPKQEKRKKGYYTNVRKI